MQTSENPPQQHSVSTGRARRASRPESFSYAIAESSDDDDDEPRPTGKSTTKKKTETGGKRLKECPGCGSAVPLSLRECKTCDYQFTSKLTGVSSGQAQAEAEAIRERFPFEPEREEEGCLIIEKILGRRPIQSITTTANKNKTSNTTSTAATAKGVNNLLHHHAYHMKAIDAKDQFEYLLKYRSLSYKHVEWVLAEDIENMSKKSKMTLTRYLTRLDRGDIPFIEETEIDPSFLEVEKVLDCREEEVEEEVEVISSNKNDDDIKKEDLKSSSSTNTSGSVNKTATTSSSSSSRTTRRKVLNNDDEIEESPQSRSLNKIFQPEERCKQILEKILDDSYATGFREPVDPDLYPDYHAAVEDPICLNDIRERLDNGEYRIHYKLFAHDMRTIWRNCKQYNSPNSSIWHSANYLSMLFERLFQAWVVSFSDGKIPMSDPKARPWEDLCVACQQDADDDQIILCDHCDVAYHTYCLNPPLKSIPEGSWMCPRCTKWLQESGATVLSATAEDEARALVEGEEEKKIITVKRKKYLVKWAGLSYKDSTWETPEDIGDDDIIAAYHALNDTPPEEPPLTQAEIGVELAKDRKVPIYPAGVGNGRENPTGDLDAQIYAQIRSYHFLKWGKTPPKALLRESGPSALSQAWNGLKCLSLPPKVVSVVEKYVNEKLSKSESNKKNDDKEDTENVEAAAEEIGVTVAKLSAEDEKNTSELFLKQQVDPYRCEVAELLGEMVYAVARDIEKVHKTPLPARPPLPSRYSTPSEIEVCIARDLTCSLGMQVADLHGHLVILNFRPRDNQGTKGPVECTGRVRPGDILVAISGVYVDGLSFVDVLRLLASQELQRQPFLYLRFLRIPPSMESKQSGTVEKFLAARREAMVAQHLKGSTSNEISTMGQGGIVSAAVASGGDVLQGSRSYFPRSKYFGVAPIPQPIRVSGLPTVPTSWEASYHDTELRKVSLGIFTDEEEAARVYDAAIRKEGARHQFRWPHNFSDDELTNFMPDSIVLQKIVQAERDALAIQRGEKQLNVDIPSPEKKSDAEEEQKGDAEEDKKENAMDTEDIESKTAEETIVAVKEDDKVDKKGEKSSPDNAPEEKPVSEEDDKTDDVSDVEDPADVDADDAMDVDDWRSIDSRDSESSAWSDDLSMSEDEEANSNYSDDDEYLDEDDDDDDDEDSIVANKRQRGRTPTPAPRPTEVAVPEKTSDTYQTEGAMARLLRAVNESEYAPNRSDWVNYILEIAKAKPTSNTNNGAANSSAPIRTRRVEQIDLVSGNVIKAWNHLVQASRALNIPANDIQANLMDKKDSAGGFKWRLADLNATAQNATTTNPLDIEEFDDEANTTKKDLSWMKRLPSQSKEYKNGGRLRDYQVEGLSWLLRCWYNKRSSILADEMGLGKTVQVVSFLDHLFEVEAIKGPFLVCVPLSTLVHWRREFEGWSNMVPCVYHDIGGGREMRDVIREYEWYYKGRSRRLLKFHVLITTYDDLVRDYEELAEVPWRAVIVDEAHRLRNTTSKLLECMRTVTMKGQQAYGYQHRVLMTGTPLQNNTMELWPLLNFIEPAKFPDLERFHQRFATITTQEQVDNLQRRIGPHLLRRVKEDVAQDIPPKEETIIDVELTTMQKQYYRAIFDRNQAFLMQNLRGAMPKLMNIQMELRKCCNHPFLIKGVEETEMDDLHARMVMEDQKSQHGKRRTNLTDQQLIVGADGSFVNRQEYERRRMEQVIIPSSGKMVLLDKLLPKLRKEGHKVLIFSQMMKMMDMMEEYCEYRKYPCERLDGRITGNDRQKSIDRFNKDPNSFVFLLSTRAGGVGINLTAADTCIIFDSDWNPQNDVQAMARCHRIGQQKSVTVYRLITRRSFESEMFDRASKKLGLEQAVLGTRNFNDVEWEETKSGIKIDQKEMERLLREGAYSVLLDDNDDDVREFCEQDIDQILQSRAHTIVDNDVGAGSGGTESWLNKRKMLSKTRKQAFTAESAKEHTEIDVDDPDFWKKVLPDLTTPESMFDRLRQLCTKSTSSKDHSEEELYRFFRDLRSMMDGTIDLSRRNQLPENDKSMCIRLLYNFLQRTSLFDAHQIQNASEWLKTIEGTRARRKGDLYRDEFAGDEDDMDDMDDEVVTKSTGRGRGGAKKKGKGASKATTAKGKGKSKVTYSSDGEGSSGDEDDMDLMEDTQPEANSDVDDIDESDDSDNSEVPESSIPKKRKRGPVPGKGKAAGYTAVKPVSAKITYDDDGIPSTIVPAGMMAEVTEDGEVILKRRRGRRSSNAQAEVVSLPELLQFQRNESSPTKRPREDDYESTADQDDSLVLRVRRPRVKESQHTFEEEEVEEMAFL